MCYSQAAIAAALGLCSGACATIVPVGPATESRRVVRQYVVQRESDAPFTQIEQDGSIVRLKLTATCKRVPVTSSMVTSTREMENEDSAIDWALLSGGAVAAGAGVVFLVDANSVHETDTTAREYNPYGPSQARAAGGGLLGLGAALLAIPIVDAIRANGTETSTKAEASDGPPRPCQGRALSDVRLTARFIAEDTNETAASSARPLLALGATDDKGSLEVDFMDAVLQRPELLDSRYTAQVLVGENKVGEVDLLPIRAVADERMWAAEPAKTCERAESETACDGLIRYLTAFPHGKHTDNARATLEKAQAVIRDETKWRAASTEACIKPTTESACDLTRAYVESLPNGRHAEEARALLRAAGPALKRLRETREREEAAAAAAARNEERRIATLGLRTSSLVVDLKTNSLVSSGPALYLNIRFDITATKRHPRGRVVEVRAACQVGDKRMVSTSLATWSLQDLEPGDTKQESAAPFILAPLDQAPEYCDIETVSTQALRRSDRQVILRYCWRPGSEPGEGRCP